MHSVPPGSVLAEVKMSESGPTVAGTSGLILTCTVSEGISGLTSVPSAQWTTVSGSVSGNEQFNNVVTETVRSDTTAVTTFSFAPSLLTSHAGQYTCIGSLNSSAADGGIITVSPYPISVNVHCELIHNAALSNFTHTHTPTPPPPSLSLSLQCQYQMCH